VNFDVKNNFSRVLTLVNCCMSLAISPSLHSFI